MQPQTPYQPPGQQPAPTGYSTLPSSGPVDQFPVDYLNQIAAPPPVKRGNPIVVFGLIGAFLLLVVGVLFFLISSFSPPSANTQLYDLQARLNTLTSVTSQQTKRLTQNDLSSLNSTLNANLTSMSTKLVAYMQDRGLKTSDNKSVTNAKEAEQPYLDALTKKLNDSYLTGTLDRTYATEMEYQLGILKGKLTSVKSAAKSNKYNEFYDANISSIQSIIDLLAKFQSTK